MENGEHFTVWVYDIDPELSIISFIHALDTLKILITTH